MVLYVQLTAHFLEGPVIKLLPIVGNQDSWDPEPTDDGLPDETFDIPFRNCRQEFCLYPFSKVVDRNH